MKKTTKQLLFERMHSIGGMPLSEGLSDIIYHGTYIDRVKNILDNNTINLTLSIGTPSDLEKNKGNEYFFSTQRANGLTGYISKHGTNAILVLDGRTLNQNYKGFPTDYWNWSFNRDDYENDAQYKQALQSKELEDRVVSKKPYIENANKYIREIHILLDNDKYNNKKEIFKMINDAKQLNINIFFYLDQTSFKGLNKSNAISKQELKSFDFKENPYKEEKIDREDIIRGLKEEIIGILTYNDLSNEDKVREVIYPKLKDNEIESIERRVKEYHNKLDRAKYYDWQQEDMITSLKYDIHNNSSNPNKLMRDIYHMFITDMRKYGKKTINEYFKMKMKNNEKDN